VIGDVASWSWDGTTDICFPILLYVVYWSKLFCDVHVTHISKSYGDVTPKSDLGRTVVAIYAILVLNAIGGLLAVSKEYLESICRTSIKAVDSGGSSSSSGTTQDEPKTTVESETNTSSKKED